MSEHTQQDLGTTASEMRPETPAANPATASTAAPTDAIAAEYHGSISRAVEAGQSGSSRSAQTASDNDSSTLTDEQWREALAAYHDGATAPAIARRFGITAQALYKATRGDGKRARKRAATVIDAADPASPDSNSASTSARTTDSNTDIASRTRDALRSTVSLDAMASAFIAIGQGLQQLATTALRIAGAAQARITREGLPTIRRKFSPEVWAAAKRDYEEGDFTAGEIAERYGMVVKTVETRASRDRWSKTVTQAPPPLLPHPDPDQVDETGASKWAKIAHPAQCEPSGKWSTWLFQGGRGAGKTRAGAEWLASRAEATPNGIFAIVAATEHDLREVMIEGPAGLRSLPGREHPKYESSRRKLRWNNGAIAYGFSAEQPERLRGPQFMAAWADEFCTWKKPHDVLSNLRLGLRLGQDPRLLITTTPRPMQALRKLREEISCVMTQAGTSANAGNLAPSFIDGLQALYGGTHLAEQELDGVLADGAGVLFRTEDFASTRCEAPAAFDRVVVAIDPPAGLNGSACGIVVAGRVLEKAPPEKARGRNAASRKMKGREWVAYVLADRSCQGATPLEWAGVAAEAAREFGATKIVAEANQGGEMVRQTLNTAGVPCPVELVHASKGKCVRAEPVSVLYQHGRVRHCGLFRDLEAQLVAMGVESVEEAGTDRADALVWAISALDLIGNAAGAPAIRRL